MQKRGINQIHDITIRHVNGKENFKKMSYNNNMFLYLSFNNN